MAAAQVIDRTCINYNKRKQFSDQLCYVLLCQQLKFLSPAIALSQNQIITRYHIMDQQLSLINREQQKLKKTRTTNPPYLINCFNTHFDHSLKQLVLDYRFDFDKIALHLYYQFPQYQQRITSRTVGFRWWQIQAERKLIQEGGNSTETQTMQSSNQQNKNQQEDKIEFFSIQNIFPPSQQPLFHPQPQFQPNHKISVESYSKALLNSQILSQQQSQRFILYKPKFIIDTQYQLQRYEVDMDAWRNSEMQRNDENMSDVMIEKLLKKVVNNQFFYDEFGGFYNSGGCEEIKGRDGDGDRGENNEVRRIQWWVEQQQSFSSQQCESEELDDSENNLLKCIPAQHDDPILPAQHCQQDKQNNKLPIAQLYDFEENWDEYESD